MAAVFQLLNPIGFDAPDELPVGLLIFLLVPEAATQKHLEILSEIAELLSDGVLREKIKTSASAADLHCIIAGWQSTQAALVAPPLPRRETQRRQRRCPVRGIPLTPEMGDRKSTRLNSSHSQISHAAFFLFTVC